MEVSVAGQHWVFGMALSFPFPMTDQNGGQKGHGEDSHAQANNHELVDFTLRHAIALVRGVHRPTIIDPVAT